MDYLPEVLGGLANALQTGSVTDNGRRLADDLGNHTPKGPCGTSFGVLECVDDWVGDGGWDVISLNWGLHDICPHKYMYVSRDQYVANMKQIIAKLKTGLAPGGTIVWVSTTPVPASYKDRNDTDVVDINGIMADLIAFDDCCDDVVFGADLYHAVVDRCNRNATWAGYPASNDCLYLQDNGVHFFLRTGQALHGHRGRRAPDALLVSCFVMRPQTITQTDHCQTAIIASSARSSSLELDGSTSDRGAPQNNPPPLGHRETFESMSESPQIVAAAYFDDKVQSLAATRHGRKFSVGIISPGTYRFGTACAERMTVTSGSLKVQVEDPGCFPDATVVVYPAGTYFEVAANAGFQVTCDEHAAYLCEYL
ncbi:DUF2263-containing protein [Aureococcus anophagefferens]|nr:DUF2263-containing protein [Aureococcus anophagefferens]